MSSLSKLQLPRSLGPNSIVELIIYGSAFLTGLDTWPTARSCEPCIHHFRRASDVNYRQPVKLKCSIGIAKTLPRVHHMVNVVRDSSHRMQEGQVEVKSSWEDILPHHAVGEYPEGLKMWTASC
jgi:hypothetical protein